jgi:predicted AAA+ superfamily ATPase
LHRSAGSGAARCYNAKGLHERYRELATRAPCFFRTPSVAFGDTSPEKDPGEAVEEKGSLSDRFRLWLGFHHCSQDDYLGMVRSYAEFYGLDAPTQELEAQALEWATTRGSRSGRTAWQFSQDLAGRLGKPLI